MQQYNLPSSSQLNTRSLARIFDNKSESYKLFWFKAILEHVLKGESEIYFDALVNTMLKNAWYMVSEFKLNLGPVFIAQYNYQKLQSEMENIASPKWRKLQRIF